METKEAIKLVTFISEWHCIQNKEKEAFQVIFEATKCGGKYKQMWEKFKNEYKHTPITREYYKNDVQKPQRFIGKIMKEFEQKYFPKEEEHHTPYADRGLDGTMDRINEYRRKNLEEIARLEVLIKEKDKCDNCAYIKLVNKFIIETGDYNG